MRKSGKTSYCTAKIQFLGIAFKSLGELEMSSSVRAFSLHCSFSEFTNEASG